MKTGKAADFLQYLLLIQRLPLADALIPARAVTVHAGTALVEGRASEGD